MKRWEYAVFPLDSSMTDTLAGRHHSSLVELGAIGWELVYTEFRGLAEEPFNKRMCGMFKREVDRDGIPV